MVQVGELHTPSAWTPRVHPGHGVVAGWRGPGRDTLPVSHLLEAADQILPAPHTQTALPVLDWQVESAGHVFPTHALRAAPPQIRRTRTEQQQRLRAWRSTALNAAPVSEWHPSPRWRHISATPATHTRRRFGHPRKPVPKVLHPWQPLGAFQDSASYSPSRRCGHAWCGIGPHARQPQGAFHGGSFTYCKGSCLVCFLPGRSGTPRSARPCLWEGGPR